MGKQERALLQQIADKLDRVIALLEPPKPVKMTLYWQTDYGMVRLPDTARSTFDDEVFVGGYTGADINKAMERYTVAAGVDVWGGPVDFEELRPHLN